MTTLFDACCSDIKSAYQSLGHRLGWRFLSGPKANLNAATKIVFISLNPGGNCDPPEHPHASQELGSSFLVESWNGRPAGHSDLQLQVGTMFKLLADGIGSGDYKSLMNNTLMGHFIPFRSPDFKSLANQTASLAFADQLWTRIFEHIEPEIVVTMDVHTFKHVRKIITNRRQGESERHIQLPTGWGNYTADIVRFGSPKRGVTLARLPHLSRFTIFTSPKCAEAMPKLIDTITSVN